MALASGATQAFLTPDALDNEAGNGFYRASGWQLADSYRTREGRLMNRYATQLAR